MSDMKIFLFLFLTVLPLAVWAQGNYESLLSEDIVWTNWCKPSINPDEYPNYYVYEEFKLKGDTVISDIPYKKVYSRRWTSYDQTPSEWTMDNHALGQEKGKVYLYISNRANPEMPGTIRLIMDFSLAEGDYFSVEDSELGRWGYSPKMVKDTVLAYFPDKENRKCLFLERRRGIDAKGDGSIEDIWMEGIGSFECGITGSMGSSSAKQQLIKCTKGDVVLFEYADPSVTDDINAALQGEVATSSIYDLQGRRLTTKPKKGVYIRNGRKYVVR